MTHKKLYHTLNVIKESINSHIALGYLNIWHFVDLMAAGKINIHF